MVECTLREVQILHNFRDFQGESGQTIPTAQTSVAIIDIGDISFCTYYMNLLLGVITL